MTMKVLIFISFFLYPSPIFGGKERISPTLLKKIEGGKPGETWNIMLEFQKAWASVASFETSLKSELSHPAEFMRRMEKQAQESQAGVMKRIVPIFKRRQASHSKNTRLKDMRTYISLWLTNELSIPYATADLIYSLADDKPENANISLIKEELVFEDKPIPPGPDNKAVVRQDVGTSGLPWGIEATGAPAWWAAGFNGTGVIIGHIDSGVDINHPELKEKWTGKGIGWTDPYEMNTEFPYDADTNSSHGTHTLGTVVGSSVGMAPGARWMACMIRVDRLISSAQIRLCFTRLFCPDPETNCSYRPNIVTNSWGLENERKPDPDPNAVPFLEMEIRLRLWQESGIVPVFAAGNLGSQGCETLDAPGDSTFALTVGATSREIQSVAYFSGRGPPTQRYPDWEQRGIFKPSMVAPGTGINSTIAKGKYNELSGTSMAAPHVAGAIALLLSRNENLNLSDIARILVGAANTEGIIYIDAQKRHSCGNDADPPGLPNQKAGFGVLRMPDVKNSSLLPAVPQPPTRAMPPPPDFTGLEEHNKRIEEIIDGKGNSSALAPGLLHMFLAIMINLTIQK